MRITRSLASALAFVALATPALADLDPFIAALPPLDGDVRAVPADVSGDGSRVLGTSFDAEDASTIVLWDDLGPATPIAGSEGGAARAISGNGTTVIGRLAESGSVYSFAWTEASGIEPLEDVETSSAPTRAFGISFDGSVIVGGVSIFNGPIDPGLRAARWNDGALSLFAPTGYDSGLPGFLIDTSSVGRIAGRLDLPLAQSRWFIGEDTSFETIENPPTAATCRLAAISDDGSAWVGECFVNQSPAGLRPTRWSDRGGEQASFLTEQYSSGTATDVSGDGSVVVGTVYDGPARRPFVWTLTDGFRLLQERLEGAGVDTSGVPLDAIDEVRVSTDGRTVVGETFVARIPVPVPEPAATLGGVAAIAALARFRVSRSSR
jgi:uncharacterized membrane protein